MSDSLQYLYLIQPTRMAMLTDGPTPQEEESISRHFDYLKALTEQGTTLYPATLSSPAAPSTLTRAVSASSSSRLSRRMQRAPS